MTMQTDTLIQRSAAEQVLWRNRLLLGIVGMHFAFGLTLAFSLDRYFESGTAWLLLMAMKTTAGFFAVNLIVWRFYHCAVKVRPKRPIQWMIQDFRAMLSDRDRVYDALIAFLAITLMVATFAVVKDMISLVQPFSWDPAFAALDRALHGGVDPWRLLWPVFGTPWVTMAINVAYHAWFVVLYFMVALAVFDRSDLHRRMTFLVAFALVWIVGGNLLAIAFSSAGPVYYEAMGFGDTFVPQMERLYAMGETVPLWALDLQETLLYNYQTEGPVRGISAMPSMHVANAVLIALFGFAYARWLGWVLSAFALLTMIGSVHLAWHYAVDGYLGAILAVACWYGAKWLAARFA